MQANSDSCSRKLVAAACLLAGALVGAPAEADTRRWADAWPRTDFTDATIDLGEIREGGPGRDGIPAVDAPRFVAVAAEDGLDPREPVIALSIAGDSRAYPLRVLTWHEIVNDTVGNVPVAVTYCPLCNAAIVFDRRVGDLLLDFGTTGKLHRSDLVMYDRQTESWWQQFSGEAIAGELAGATLTMLPARLESWAEFKRRAPRGLVLRPNDPEARPYGTNPYVGYDTSGFPFLYDGEVPAGVDPLARVVVVGREAWTFDLLQHVGRVVVGDLVITWVPGQASALDG